MISETGGHERAHKVYSYAVKKRKKTKKDARRPSVRSPGSVLASLREGAHHVDRSTLLATRVESY